LKYTYIWIPEQDGGVKGDDTEEISNWTTRRENADMQHPFRLSVMPGDSLYLRVEIKLSGKEADV
jgi:hypothetical protein